jgi:hypothetical protein
MKSTVQTRIFISLTPDEARQAVNDAIDMQLCVRGALNEIDGEPVSTLIRQQNDRKLLAAPKRNARKHVRNGHKARVQKATSPAATVECPECHRMVKSRGLNIHIAKSHKETPVTLEA